MQIENKFENEAELEGKYLTFYSDMQVFGIPISKVVEIVSLQEITSVPEYPRYIKGIINLRSRIISVIDMRLRLNRAEIPYDEKTCIIIIDISGKHVGFIVDEVKEVLDIAYSDISEREQLTPASGNDYLIGFAKTDESVILILDPDKILNETDFAYL
jgi:purine-binding chemotaxis protein CheW